MILLRNVTLVVGDSGTSRTVLDNVTAEIPTNQRFGIIAPTAGDTTALISLLAGLIEPSTGTIERYAHLSFPIAYEGLYKRNLSPRNNIMRLREMFDEEGAQKAIEFIATITGLGDMIDAPLHSLSAEMQRRFVFAASYALPFDCYLLDEKFACGPADEAFRARCSEMLQSRAASNGIIYASSRPPLIQRFCNEGALLFGGSLTYYSNLNDAIAIIQKQAHLPAAARDDPQFT